MSYHKLTPSPTGDEIEPEEPAMSLDIGKYRIEGSVKVTRDSERSYTVECRHCGWREKYSSINVCNWLVFAHSWRHRRQGNGR